jgi:hypothetical protein
MKYPMMIEYDNDALKQLRFKKFGWLLLMLFLQFPLLVLPQVDLCLHRHN